MPTGTSGDLGLTNNSLFKRKPSLTKSPSHSPPPTLQVFKSSLRWQRAADCFPEHLALCMWWHIHCNPGDCKSWKLDLCKCDGTNRWISCAFPQWQGGLEWEILKHERSQCCHSRNKGVMGELVNGDRSSLWSAGLWLQALQHLVPPAQYQTGLSSSRAGVGNAVGGAYFVLHRDRWSQKHWRRWEAKGNLLK